MAFAALGAAGEELVAKQYYSIGGASCGRAAPAPTGSARTTGRCRTRSAAGELLEPLRSQGVRDQRLMIENKTAWRPSPRRTPADAHLAGDAGLRAARAAAAKACCRVDQLRRRAPSCIDSCPAAPEAALRDPLTILDW